MLNLRQAQRTLDDPAGFVLAPKGHYVGSVGRIVGLVRFVTFSHFIWAPSAESECRSGARLVYSCRVHPSEEC